MSTNVCAKFRCAALRIKKALGIFRELIQRARRRTTRTTRVAFWGPLPGPKIVHIFRNFAHRHTDTRKLREHKLLVGDNDRICERRRYRAL